MTVRRGLLFFASFATGHLLARLATIERLKDPIPRAQKLVIRREGIRQQGRAAKQSRQAICRALQAVRHQRPGRRSPGSPTR